MQVLYKSLPNSVQVPFFAYSMERTFTDFATDLQRTCNGRSTKAKQPLSRIAHFHIQKNRIFTLLVNSAPVALQQYVHQRITWVIHFVSLVTHSSPLHDISF